MAPENRRPQSSGPGKLGGSRGNTLSVDQLKMTRGGSRQPRGGMASISSHQALAPQSAEKESRFCVEEGAVVRQQSETRRSTATELSTLRLERSNEAIQERIRQTQEQKEALQDSLADVLEQSETLEQLQATIDDISAQEGELVPMLRTVSRERKTRMTKHAGHDEVDYWLKGCASELDSSLYPKMLVDMRKLSSAMAKLSPELTQAIEEKADAVVVDLECLNMDPSNVMERTIPVQAGGGSVQSNTRRQMSMAQQLIEKADLRCQQTTNLQQKVVAYSGRRAPAESLNALLDTYHAMIDDGNNSAEMLQECLEQGEMDLESYNEELAELTDCIAEQSGQLQVTQTRLQTRKTEKPARESTYDRADHALESERDQLMKAITKLHVQQKKLRSNRHRMSQSVADITRQLELQEEGLNVDGDALATIEEQINSLKTCIEEVQ